jgi:beta-mannosidase
VSVTTRRFAQWVVIEVPGFLASDSWFHLAPGATRTLGLERLGGAGDGESDDRQRPSGHVRALNAGTTARVVVS